MQEKTVSMLLRFAKILNFPLLLQFLNILEFRNDPCQSFAHDVTSVAETLPRKGVFLIFRKTSSHLGEV